MKNIFARKIVYENFKLLVLSIPLMPFFIPNFLNTPTRAKCDADTVTVHVLALAFGKMAVCRNNPLFGVRSLNSSSNTPVVPKQQRQHQMARNGQSLSSTEALYGDSTTAAVCTVPHNDAAATSAAPLAERTVNAAAAAPRARPAVALKAMTLQKHPVIIKKILPKKYLLPRKEEHVRKPPAVIRQPNLPSINSSGNDAKFIDEYVLQMMPSFEKRYNTIFVGGASPLLMSKLLQLALIVLIMAFSLPADSLLHTSLTICYGTLILCTSLEAAYIITATLFGFNLTKNAFVWVIYRNSTCAVLAFTLVALSLADIVNKIHTVELVAENAQSTDIDSIPNTADLMIWADWHFPWRHSHTKRRLTGCCIAIGYLLVLAIEAVAAHRCSFGRMNGNKIHQAERGQVKMHTLERQQASHSPHSSAATTTVETDTTDPHAHSTTSNEHANNIDISEMTCPKKFVANNGGQPPPIMIRLPRPNLFSTLFTAEGVQEEDEEDNEEPPLSCGIDKPGFRSKVISKTVEDERQNSMTVRAPAAGVAVATESEPVTDEAKDSDDARIGLFCHMALTTNSGLV